MTKRVAEATAETSDGQRATVLIMDNGTVHLILPAGQPYSILTHFSGSKGTRVRLAPVGIAPETIGEDDEGAEP